MSEEEKKAAEEAAKKKADDTTPPTVKIGDKEYTPEQLEKAIETNTELQEWSEKNGDWRSLKSDYTKKSQKIADLEKAKDNINDTKQNVQGALDGSISLKDMSEEEANLYRDIKKGKGLTVDDIPNLIEKASEIAYKRFSEESDKNKKEEEKVKLKETLERQISDIAKANDFVDEGKLKNFMRERSEQGEILMPETAFKILYAPQLSTDGKTPDNLPAVDKSKEGDLKDTKPAKSYTSLNDPAFQEDATKAFEDIMSR